jgi:hypothetical protein
MAEFLDEISPRHYGEDRLRLTLTERNQVLRAFAPVLVTVDYSAALPEGIVLPLEFTVTAPSAVNSTRMVFRRFAPNELAFTPREGGSHLIRLAEMWHNMYWGKLVLEIAGDRLRGA